MSSKCVLHLKIHTLNSKQFYLLNPFDVIIELDEHGPHGSIKELEIYAECKTIIGVMDKIREQLTCLYNDLHNTPGTKLGPLPRLWKQILEAKIRRYW